jgi:hypothetical protein
MKELSMDKEMYVTLHHSADRMALEASRKADAGEEADCYTKNYGDVIKFLVSEYEKNEPKDE